MKRLLVLISLFFSFGLFGQNEFSIGAADYPLAALGANFTVDFGVMRMGSKAHIALGGYLFADQFKSHEEPMAGKRYHEVYAAPQASVHYSVTDNFDCFLRGGAGWLFSDKKDSGLWFNTEIGASFYFTRHLGVRVELGLPFCSIGLTLRL